MGKLLVSFPSCTRHWHLHNTSVVHAATMPSVVGRPRSPVLVLAFIAVFACIVHASKGDRLPEFKQCLAICKTENCGANGPHTPIPLLHRLMLWNCASECDYTCQHIITNRRLDASLPVVQFHGKWPFHRFLGMQEPFSVLFSLGNLFAHYYGLRKLRQRVPASYTLRPFCIGFAYVGIASWVFSAIFHSRDFQMTEELDYFAAGLNVLYGTYLSAVRIFRLDIPSPRRRSVLRAWSLLCLLLYMMHVGYLKGIRWDYTYNMAANVAVGMVQNVLWSWFSIDKYRKSKRFWTTWPGLAVAWIMLGMSMELFDFPPWLGCVDAHSLWHLMTIGPTVLWYNFLVKDSHENIASLGRSKE